MSDCQNFESTLLDIIHDKCHNSKRCCNNKRKIKLINAENVELILIPINPVEPEL